MNQDVPSGTAPNPPPDASSGPTVTSGDTPPWKLFEVREGVKLQAFVEWQPGKELLLIGRDSKTPRSVYRVYPATLKGGDVVVHARPVDPWSPEPPRWAPSMVMFGSPGDLGQTYRLQFKFPPTTPRVVASFLRDAVASGLGIRPSIERIVRETKTTEDYPFLESDAIQKYCANGFWVDLDLESGAAWAVGGAMRRALALATAANVLIKGFEPFVSITATKNGKFHVLAKGGSSVLSPLVSDFLSPPSHARVRACTSEVSWLSAQFGSSGNELFLDGGRQRIIEWLPSPFIENPMKFIFPLHNHELKHAEHSLSYWANWDERGGFGLARTYSGPGPLPDNDTTAIQLLNYQKGFLTAFAADYPEPQPDDAEEE